jgi:signal transduction histidine kinase
VLFTRTIRRKLLVGVGVVMGMLVILSVTAIMGLNSYRSLIHQLNFHLNEAPQQGELVGAVGAIFKPLLWRVKSQADAAFQKQQLEGSIARANDRLQVFRRRTDGLPPAPVWVAQRPLTDSRLQDYEMKLDALKHLSGKLDDAQVREETIRRMLEITARLEITALQIPDPGEGMSRSLAQARNAYRSSLVAVGFASAVVLVLFASLLRSGYVWIFAPIRKLHEGARRVAQGDFRYRLELKTRDEMGELADAFNKMTGRFQEIAADLDRQVQERSRQLVRSERLAGVGFLAAGVAHEINNPLSAIAMASESLEGRVLGILGGLEPAEADVIRQYLRMIQDESFRCKQITERLLDFSRGREAVREPTDIARLISEVVAMVRYLSKYREKKIEFKCAGPCCAEVNGPEIKQVILNLVANGLDAVDRGGHLKISLRDRTDHLVVEFIDDGCGMTSDTIDNLFEPFFTRKQAGQGTGLGLSISHRIINQHGGTISASSPGPGLGSTFSVRLPRHAESQPVAA